MFDRLVTPESVGVSSAGIHAFLQDLEKAHLSTHDVLIARGEQLCFEKYYAPFTEDFLHRMYSVSKSFVAIAVGFALQDGLLTLDTPLGQLFPEEAKLEISPALSCQTVRQMLTMSTARIGNSWFTDRTPDRVRHYFESPNPAMAPGGVWWYDSEGSFMLGAAVERLTGKPFMEYLREKLLRTIGVSEGATCLTCPGGHSWGDSAVLCTPKDLALVARFMMQGGQWDGEQLLDAGYVHDAVTKQIDNCVNGVYDWETGGYGYYIWCGLDGSFFFNGMGCQLALCLPKQDLLLVYNGDNQGKPDAKKTIFDSFYKNVACSLDTADATDTAAFDALAEYTDALQLMTDSGEATSPMAEKVNGKTYALQPNPMGITRFTLTFDGEGRGSFAYTNAQGDKKWGFGFGENIFGVFPQTGYSDRMGAVSCPGHRYGCAVSAGWVSPFQLHIKVQIIDAYFGTLDVMLGFTGQAGEKVTVLMSKTAEDFLDEYNGWATGTAE